MKIVVQRVRKAQVRVDGNVTGAISKGMVIFLGVAKSDTPTQADYLAQKIVELRMFEDEKGKMNISSLEAQAAMLVVSQFTLYGDCRKGRRPSFDEAADPVKGEALYQHFVESLRRRGVLVQTGIFRAMMDVELINDGPVTFVLESL